MTEHATTRSTVESQGRVRRWSWIATVALVLVSLLQHWPYLSSGYTPGDLVFVRSFEQEPPPYSRSRGLWGGLDPTSSGEVIAGLGHPWWADEDVTASFFRPVPSLIWEASYRAFGRDALPMHLLSILLHGLSGVLLWLAVRRLAGSRVLGFVAALIYLVCEDHSMTVGMINFCTDVLCVFLCNLALLLHVLWLRRRRRAALLASLVALLLALGCKETAVAVAPVLVLTSFLFPRGTESGGLAASGAWLPGRVRALFSDPLSWAPATALAVIFLAAYKAVPLGCMNNLMYLDPLSHPWRYLTHVIVHMPIMWLATFTPIPPSLEMLVPGSALPLALGGAAVAALLVGLLWPHRQRPLVAWAAVLYLVTLLPQLGADAGERLLYYPYVFASVLLAVLVMQISPLARRFDPDRPRAHWIARGAGWLLLLTFGIGAMALSSSYAFMFRQGFGMDVTLKTAIPHMEETDRVILVNSPNEFVTLFADPLLEEYTGRALDVRLLSACRAAMTLEKVDDQAFVLHADRPGWLSNLFGRAVRTQPTFDQDRTYRNDWFEARLIELTEDREDVLSVRFELLDPSAGQPIALLAWDGDAYNPLNLASLHPFEPIDL